MQFKGKVLKVKVLFNYVSSSTIGLYKINIWKFVLKILSQNFKLKQSNSIFSMYLFANQLLKLLQNRNKPTLANISYKWKGSKARNWHIYINQIVATKSGLGFYHFWIKELNKLMLLTR